MLIKPIKHKIIKCNIKACKEHATRWMDTALMSGDFDCSHRSTFYLCEHHASTLSPEDDIYTYLNPETGKIRQIELAVYSCDDNCPICNQ